MYHEIRNKLLQNEITCVELTLSYLNKIAAGKRLNAFISIFGERALQKAAKIDSRLEQGKIGKLAGLIIAIKDNININGERTTCGSKILSNFISPYDATVIQKLESEDAIIIGKTNMDEFSMGSSNENSCFGPTRNPHNLALVPGGSSGGSAAAVAADLAMAALGSDTGGSIRQPAAFCGVVGLKPTYGRVSRFGLVAFGSSFDQIGPLTRTVEDCTRIMEVIAGHDERDSTSANLPVPLYVKSLHQHLMDITVGIPKEYFVADLDSDIRLAIENSIRILEESGTQVKQISLPHTEYAIANYYILVTAEASSNLARYDGARYGSRHPGSINLEDMYLQSRSQGFSDEVKRRIMLGTYVLSSGYYDAYYRKAQKVRTLIRQDFEEAFQHCDCIITPTTPTTAFQIGDKIDQPLQMFLSDIYTVPISLAGLPAVSLPCGFDKNKLPIGLQIVAKPFHEEMIFRIAHFLEQQLSLSFTLNETGRSPERMRCHPERNGMSP